MDVNLLLDAMRGLLRTLHRTCAAHEVRGWHKGKDWFNKVQKAFNKVRNEAKVEAYLELCTKLITRAEMIVEKLQAREIATDKIEQYLADALR